MDLQILIQNLIQILKVIAAPSSTLGDYVNPTGDVGWRRLTFENGGAPRDTIVTNSDGPAAVTVFGARRNPQTGGSYEPQWTWTDWTPLTSVPRSDVPDAPRIVMIRVLFPSKCTHTRPNGGFLEYHQRQDINQGFAYVAGHVPADFVTYPHVIPAVTAVLGHSNAPVSCVQFLTRKPGIVGMTTGDSHHQGTSTTSQFWNYLLRSVTNIGRHHVGHVPFGYWSTAQGGANSGLFFSALENVIPVARPSFVVLPGWTYNDVSDDVHANQAAVDVFFARLLMTAEKCTQHGATPIFLTPFPRDPGCMSSTQVQPWLKLRDAILALRDFGAIVVDATPLLGSCTDGSLDGMYRTEYSDDSMHPNDFGHAILANKLSPIIEGLSGLISM